MVDKKTEKRLAPAPDPKDFPTFHAWLGSATERRGQQAELASYCDVIAQNVHKWLQGFAPKETRLRRLIAEWAQVDTDALSDLIERHEAWRKALPKKPAGKRAKKTRIPSQSRAR